MHTTVPHLYMHLCDGGTTRQKRNTADSTTSDHNAHDRLQQHHACGYLQGLTTEVHVVIAAFVHKNVDPRYRIHSEPKKQKIKLKRIHVGMYICVLYVSRGNSAAVNNTNKETHTFQYPFDS